MLSDYYEHCSIQYSTPRTCHTQLFVDVTCVKNKIKRSSKTIITHLSFRFIRCRQQKMAFNIGSEYFVFQNNMSDKVHQRILKNYFDSFCRYVGQLAFSC